MDPNALPTSAETPLELALRAGPLPQRTTRETAPYILGAAAIYAALAWWIPFLLDPVPFLAAALILVGAFIWTHWTVDVADVRARLAGSPVPIGPLDAWVVDKEYFIGNRRHRDTSVWFGVFELVLRATHPLAEAAVRLAEPQAVCTWTAPTRLRIDVPWSGHEPDLERLERLVRLLGTHRDELGLERVELLPSGSRALQAHQHP